MAETYQTQGKIIESRPLEREYPSQSYQLIYVA